MQTAMANRSHQYFDLPDNVIKVPINPDTGKLAGDQTDNAVMALFKKGTEPREHR
jgi:membrane carboxypeptidase/penicillin-binding protein